jgi:type II secretory pathway component GspD/PulD (secretin)
VLVDEIESDITAIDTPRKHIMLDARVVALESSDLLNFGGQWTMHTLNAGTALGDAVKWPWALEIGYSPDRDFTNALSLTLNLLSQNNQATIIASPQVLAQDGKEADIKATTEEYFPISASNGTFVNTNLEKIETGTILKITPQIGADGDITLDMDIEVSDVIARGSQNLPVVSRRTAHSTVQLQDGGTAASRRSRRYAFADG